MRLRELERVVVAGRVSFTAPALNALMRQGVLTTFLSRSGKPVGQLLPCADASVHVRLAQFRRLGEPAFRRNLGRVIVSAKIQNSRRVLQLFARHRPGLSLERELALLQRIRRRLAGAEGLPQLMGREGEAAALYFKAFTSLILGELSFSGRTRRPPRDPVNSLLSLGYTLLASEVVGALVGAGLQPALGLLHEVHTGRPSLALDLIEEFRQPVIDRFVLSLTNRRILREPDFTTRDGGVFLHDRPRIKFFRFYDRMMTTPFLRRSGARIPDGSNKATFRALLHEQAEALATHILTGKAYHPFILR